MPENPFPDSVEKQALRLRDGALLRRFQSSLGGRRLRYCGLTSAEFRDVQAWRNSLESVCAVEQRSDVRNDMRINWRRLNLGMHLDAVSDDILDFLVRADTPLFDVYNLDFCGGFTNPQKSGKSRCREAVRSIAERHRSREAPFVLVATFNIRDRGVEAYDQFLSELEDVLRGLDNVEENLNVHGTSHAMKIKLSYTFVCWHAAKSNDFDLTLTDPFVYSSGRTTLTHFYSEFTYRARPLPQLNVERENLAQIASLPLRRMVGRIARTEVRPPVITKN